MTGPTEQVPSDPAVGDEALAALPVYTGRTPRGLGRTPPPLRVKIELVVVSGAERRYLRHKQDEAIRSTLRWFAENPPENAGLGH
jgi:hypothetical protein